MHKVSFRVGQNRLLRLAEILDTADADHRSNKEPRYRQDAFFHSCGTPACALGHWAANNQRRWRVSTLTGLLAYKPAEADGGEHFLSKAAECEFGISHGDFCDIFEMDGCGGAKTAKQAAKFIRKFVKGREAKGSQVRY